jgi:hypothetical protein
MDSNPKSEREAYIERLEDKLRKAGRAQRFLGHEDGALLTDYLTEQINSIVKSIGGKKYINDHEGYVFETGQLYLAQKLLGFLNTEANTNTEIINNQITEAKQDGGLS